MATFNFGNFQFWQFSILTTQVEAEQPLEENKLEAGTTGPENPKIFLKDEDEGAWAYRKLGLEQ